MTYTEHPGDATNPDIDGPLVIAHVLSTAGAYDEGFAAQLAKRHPTARSRYKAWAAGLESGTARPFRLGAVQWIAVGHDLPARARFDRWVLNMVTMRGLRSPTNPVPLDVPALTEALTALADGARASSLAVVMPRIGCGLAGGTWDTIGPLVQAQLTGIPTTVYLDRPQRPPDTPERAPHTPPEPPLSSRHLTLVPETPSATSHNAQVSQPH